MIISHCFAVNCGKLHQIVRMCTINNHHVSCRNVKRNCIDYNVHFHFHLQCASHSVVVVMCLQCVSRQTMTPSNLSPFHSRRNLCRSKCIRQYRNALFLSHVDKWNEYSSNLQLTEHSYLSLSSDKMKCACICYNHKHEANRFESRAKWIQTDINWTG